MSKETVTGEYYIKIANMVGLATPGKDYYIPRGSDYDKAVGTAEHFAEVFGAETTIVTADIDLEDGYYAGDAFKNAMGVSFYESGEHFRETGVGRKTDA